MSSAESGAEAIDGPDLSPSPRDALARLTPFGWKCGLFIQIALLTLSFFLAGYFIVYWRNADMDLIVVRNALALNDGLPSAYFDHPAYLTILSLRLWYQLLHHLGLLDAWRLSAIPSASHPEAFDAAMTSAVRAGRLLVWLIATICIVIFATMIRAIVDDWRLAALATFAFAFSGGVQEHARVLRSEMIAACLVLFAFMILIIAAQRANIWRPILIAGAAMLCVLGLENKIHVIFLIAALPALVLPFGSATGASAPFWRTGMPPWIATLAVGLVAAALLAAAAPLIRTGLDPAATAAAQIHPLIAGHFGVYQVALIGWICLCVIAFAALWRVSVVETVATLLAINAGATLGLMALYLQYDISNAVIIINPVEKMMQFAGAQANSAATGLGATIKLLLESAGGVLERYTFVLHTSARPTIFLVWLIVPGIFYAWRRNKQKLAIQAGLLILVAIAIDTLGLQRGLKIEYFVFTDPLIIIAGTLLLAGLNELRLRNWAYPIGVALVVLHVGISQADPAKNFFKRSGPEGICEWNQYYLPLLPLPWCDLPPKRP